MALPWEISAGTLPFELPSVLWPRTISVTRLETISTVGALPYQGTTQAAETTLITGIICNISASSSGRNSSGAGGLPDDSPGPIKWTVELPPSVMPTMPLVTERDFIYDDLGRRFQVDAYEPTTLGAKIDTVRLTA